jgi:hypothetical protein
MFEFLFGTKKVEMNDLPLVIKHFNNFPVSIYNSLVDPRFSVREINAILNFVHKNETTETCSEDELIDILMEVSDNKHAKKFIKWIKSTIRELVTVRKISYEEIEKRGHVYILKTDGGTKVGRTKGVVDKRKKELQTGNVNDITTLMDFETSNDVVLEKVVHYILDRFRCNHNREFFDCDIEHLKNVVEISGIVIDTLKSCFDTIPKQELLEKIADKLNASCISVKRKRSSNSLIENKFKKVVVV